MSDKEMPDRVPVETEKFLRAVQRGTVQEVLSQLMADPTLINAEEASGRTAIHFAAYLGRLDIIDALLSEPYKNTIEIDHEDFDGNTALALAAKQRDARVISYLIAKGGADVAKRLKRNVTAFHHAACVADNVPVMKALVAGGAIKNAAILTEAIDGGTPLHWACHFNDTINAAYLIDELGVDVDVRDEHGGTPLYVASFLKNADVVRFLLERGADIGAKANDGTTPLSHTVEEVKDLEIIKLMVSFDHEGTVSSQTKSDLKVIQTELDRPKLSAEKRAESCARFKSQGNNVFAASEFVKAARFYTLAISYDLANHALFSNRSACYYNLGQHRRALADARQCVRIKPDWAKGYFRVAAALLELGELEECEAMCKKGLSIDAANADLKATLDNCHKKFAKKVEQQQK